MTTEHMKHEPAGLTLVHMLAVIAVLMILAGITVQGTQVWFQRARDMERMKAVKTFKEGLALNYQGGNHYYYPGESPANYDYYARTGTSCGAVVINDQLQADRSEAGAGIIDGLSIVPLYKDPLGGIGTPPGQRHECYYLVDKVSDPAKAQTQRYYLHCRLENPNKVSQNDGGCQDELHEIYEPEPWLCVVFHGDPITCNSL